tara:strand:- start:4 stop:543 length:540 start_codon:yes stop_codon:yes gene_type:complete
VYGPPDPPNQTIHPEASGGRGSTVDQIITGMYANNNSRSEGYTSFDNRGDTERGSSNNVKYQSLIIQAKPGDRLHFIGRINTSEWMDVYCEFWVWIPTVNLPSGTGTGNGNSWYKFAVKNAGFSGNKDFNAYYTIPSNIVADNYALAVACSYRGNGRYNYGVGTPNYRSWKSYSLEVWT